MNLRSTVKERCYKIAKGDVVKLKGINSPKMLANSDEDQTNRVWCIWFNKSDILEGKQFDTELLELCNESTNKSIEMEDVKFRIRQYILQNQKIQAIKEYRTHTGLGLKESKDIVEYLIFTRWAHKEPLTDIPTNIPITFQGPIG